MANLDNELEVTSVKHRLTKLGVSIDPFIKKITRIFKNPAPIGFGFLCEDTAGLIKALVLSNKFGLDNKSENIGKIATLLSTGQSFREINEVDSLHFNISKVVLARTGDNCSVHLDKVSISSAMDENGNVIQDVSNIFPHLVRDQFNRKDIIVPSGKDGLVLGLRW